MALIKNGTDLLLFARSGSEGYKQIAHTTNFSVDFSTNMREISNKTTGKMAAYLPGKQDVAISADGMVCWDEAYNADLLTTLWKNQTKVVLMLADRSGSSTDTAWTGSLSNYGSGSFYISGLTIQSPYEDNVTFSAKFQLGEDGFNYTQG